MTGRISFAVACFAVAGSIAALGCYGDHAAPLQTKAAGETAKIADPADAKPVTPAEREKALELLNAAIIAHGGATNLAKLQTMILRSEGTLQMFGINTGAVQELQLRFPDYLRLSITLMKDTGKEDQALAIRPSGAWVAANGTQDEIRVADQIEDLRNELYMLWVRTLSPLKNEEFVLRPLTVEFFNKRPAEGILVTRKGRPNIALYFDTQTHWLVHLAAPVWREAGSIQRRDIDFQDHQPTGDLVLPTIQIDNRGGRPYGYWVKTTYRFPEKIEDKVFERP